MGQFSANSTQLELPVFEFFGILAWVFSRFCLSFEFFHEFLEYLKKVQIFSNFWKYLMIKRLFLGVPLSFSPKNWVFIQFSNNSTQLELPVFEFFRSFAWVFSRFSLSFEFFWAWVFFEMSKKKPDYLSLFDKWPLSI